MTAANEMVHLGLKDLGYEYVNSKLYNPALVIVFLTLRLYSR
jgi:hypothetical protein